MSDPEVSKPVALRVPASLLAALTEEAKSRRQSRHAYIVTILENRHGEGPRLFGSWLKDPKS